MTATATPPAPTRELAPALLAFKRSQKLAYACAEAIAHELREGDTERQVALRMRKWLVERGVDDWFHKPFAWFGDRTAFRGFRSPHTFFPTDRKLEKGMPYILDVAPALDGVCSDIGYAGSFGKNELQHRMTQDLADHRRVIVEGVKAGKTLRAVYDDVDRLLAKQGYDNRHRAYPGSVLAHRVEQVSGPGRGWTIAGFGVRAIRALMGDFRANAWGPGASSDHLPAPGLWAVEPHYGLRGTGVKFEELLVVTESDAFWLDDDLPHVRRFGTAGGVA